MRHESYTEPIMAVRLQVASPLRYLARKWVMMLSGTRLWALSYIGYDILCDNVRSGASSSLQMTSLKAFAHTYSSTEVQQLTL